MGGTTGLTTSLNTAILDHRDAGFIAGLWAIAAFCIAGALVALATQRPWGRRLARQALRALAWFGFVLLAVRVLDIYLEFGTGLTGLTTVAAGERAEFLRLAPWFLFLWLPWFTLGAVAWGALASRHAHQAQPLPHSDLRADRGGRRLVQREASRVLGIWRPAPGGNLSHLADVSSPPQPHPDDIPPPASTKKDA
jgi:Protein of unknown function (DUF3995)